MMKIICTILLVSLISLSLFTGCVLNSDNDSTNENKFANESINLSSETINSSESTESKETESISNEYNPIISEEKQVKPNRQVPFSEENKKNINLNIFLPDGWTLEERKSSDSVFEHNYPLDVSTNSVKDIYDENGKNIGAVGYSEYKEYEGAENYPEAIYASIHLSTQYSFETHRESVSYIPVRQTQSGINATVGVYYSPSTRETLGYEREQHFNKGIVSYNSDLLVFIAMDFDSEAISEELQKKIAQSITITSAE